MYRESLRRKLHIWESFDTSWVNSVTQMDEITKFRTKLEKIYIQVLHLRTVQHLEEREMETD